MRPGAVTKTGSLEAALAGIRRLNGVAVTSGLQGTAASGEKTGGELVTIGTALEYGVPRFDSGDVEADRATEAWFIPPRPFMRTSVERYGLNWVVGWDKAVRAATDDDRAKMLAALRLTGQRMAGDIQATINEGPWLPNAPETVRLKSTSAGVGDQPLVDSGQMKQSIRSQVEAPGSAPVVVA